MTCDVDSPGMLLTESHLLLPPSVVLKTYSTMPRKFSVWMFSYFSFFPFYLFFFHTTYPTAVSPPSIPPYYYAYFIKKTHTKLFSQPYKLRLRLYICPSLYLVFRAQNYWCWQNTWGEISQHFLICVEGSRIF